jgi:hypothetical protein
VVEFLHANKILRDWHKVIDFLYNLKVLLNGIQLISNEMNLKVKWVLLLEEHLYEIFGFTKIVKVAMLPLKIHHYFAGIHENF